MYKFNEIMGRLKEYFGVSTNKKVGELLNLDYNTIKSWSSRRKIVVETLLTALRGKNININWLFTGNGNMKLSESEILLNDISVIERAFNSSIDPMLLDKISKSENMQELINLLDYAPDGFLEQIIVRLKEFKEMSKI